MKLHSNQPLVRAIAVTLLAGAFASVAEVKAQIEQVLPLNYGITGVRQWDASGNMILTGGTGPASLDTASPAFLYEGTLPSTTSASGTYTNNLTPMIGGSAVTGGVQFYSANTPYYDPSIGTGNVLAVGAYKVATNSTYQDGVLYHGPLTGSIDSNSWTAIHVPDALATGTNLVGDTIPHSIMGDLIVGNFDTQASPFGQGFVYNIRTSNYSKLTFGAVTTIYGIWQDGGSASTIYTMVGGYSTATNANQNGFLVNYDSANGQSSNFTPMSFNNDRSLVTHFEGISSYSNGFSLAATTTNGAAFAYISTNSSGFFATNTNSDGLGIASWIGISNTINSSITTGDTVFSNSVMGIYPTTGGISSFVATVPEPSDYALYTLGSLALLIAFRRSRLV